MELMGLILVVFALLHLPPLGRRLAGASERAAVAFAAGLLFTGALHFASPEKFLGMIPPALPWPLALVYASGVAEILLAAGLVARRTRRWAGVGAVLLLLAVFPANIHVAMAGETVPGLPQVGWYYWVRLPFQALYIAWVVWAAEIGYRAVVGRKVKEAFLRVTSGHHDAFFERIAPRFVYRFSGSHALGGERRTADAMRRWFERLSRLFPRIEMDVHETLVSGWPWDTRVLLHWRDRVTPSSGHPVDNAGVHLFRLRWGRITRIDAYLDTERVAAACRQMAAEVPEAAGAPIIG